MLVSVVVFSVMMKIIRFFMEFAIKKLEEDDAYYCTKAYMYLQHKL
jgi:hypothetical protein